MANTDKDQWFLLKACGFSMWSENIMGENIEED